MSNAIRQIMEKVDARILRERILIFLTLLAVIFFLWSFLVQNHLDNVRKALDLDTQKVNSEQTALENRIAELTQAMTSDPAIIRKREIDGLNQQIGAVETRLSGLSKGLISAAQLPKALEDVLQKATAIHVLQVQTLPVTELSLAVTKPEQTTGSTGKTSAGTGVFKHGVLIRVGGTYQQLLQLMKAIESLEWKFYWESLDYQVTRYPEATIDIRVFTLSSEEGLLGV